MGCGSSSLKGDAPDGLSGGDNPQPIRKVNTNFSTINYDVNDNQKRRMTEYAPHETVRNKSEAGASTDRPAAPKSRPSGAYSEGPDGEKLEPYQTAGEGPDAIPLSERSYPHEKRAADGSVLANGDGDGLDPTSEGAKESFARANDPLNHQSQGESSLTPEEGDAKKKRGSWIEKMRGGEKKEVSDEEMKKV